MGIAQIQPKIAGFVALYGTTTQLKEMMKFRSIMHTIDNRSFVSAKPAPVLACLEDLAQAPDLVPSG
jgi:hypothetical protein